MADAEAHIATTQSGSPINFHVFLALLDGKSDKGGKGDKSKKPKSEKDGKDSYDKMTKGDDGKYIKVGGIP